MKVLIAAGIYPPDSGGPALHAQRQYKWFKENGIETDLVVFSHFRKYPRGIRHFLYLLKLLSKAKHIDTIYAHDALSVGVPAQIAAILLKKKLVVRVGGDLAWEREAERGRTDLSMLEWYEGGKHKSDKKYKLTRYVLTHADHIIVPSTILSDLYKKFYGVEKITVIPNPLPDNITPSPYEIPKTIVYASRLVAYKNLTRVLSVLSKILPEFPDTRFVVMGDGPERKFLETRTQAHGIGEQVIFTGTLPREEVRKYIEKSYIALAPALTEFNPNYILEALSFGKPVLVSKENGIPVDFPEEFLFDPRDEEELERRLRFLLNRDGYRFAEEFVKSIEFKETWETNLEANKVIIQG
jgi:glycosyltransferase involved in cell wall biosynthesis